MDVEVGWLKSDRALTKFFFLFDFLQVFHPWRDLQLLHRVVGLVFLTLILFPSFPRHAHACRLLDAVIDSVVVLDSSCLGEGGRAESTCCETSLFLSRLEAQRAVGTPIAAS